MSSVKSADGHFDEPDAAPAGGADAEDTSRKDAGASAPVDAAAPLDPVDARIVSPDLALPSDSEVPPVLGLPLTNACAGNLGMSEIALYQGVKITLAKDGGAVTSRPTAVVARRPALVRVFVTKAAGWAGGDVTVKLTVNSGGADTTYEQRKTILASSTDATLNSTFNFDVPADALAPDASYFVEMVPAACIDAASARFPKTGAAALTPVRTGTMRLVLVPIRYDSDQSGRMPDTSPTQLATFRSTLLALYPFEDVQITVRETVGTTLNITATSGWTSLLESMRALRKSDVPGSDVYYYGVINPADTAAAYCGSSCTAGVAYQSGPEDSATRVGVGIGFAGGKAAEAMAHEIGHEHGRVHSPCGSVKDPDADYPYAGGYTGVWGWDARSRTLIDPGRAKDLMGYCDPRWISDYTYRGVLERGRLVNSGGDRLAITPLSVSVGTVRAERFRTALVDGGHARWGLGTSGAPFGARLRGSVLDAEGAVVAEVDVYQTAVGDAESAVLLVPEPQSGWASVRLPGVATPLPFAEAADVPTLVP